MEPVTLEALAQLVVETLDAQQTYFKLSRTGYQKEKLEALQVSKEKEKTLRAAANSILHKPQSTQQNLFN